MVEKEKGIVVGEEWVIGRGVWNEVGDLGRVS